MNSMRKVFACLVATMALAAFALPAVAQKVYTLNLSPTSLTSGSSGVALTATMNNISPDTGNSSVKSFKLFAPTGGGITITAPASGSNVPLGGGYTATIQNNGTSIYVSNINLPLKPFGPDLVLNMTVNVACSATGGTWSTQGQVWTGTGFTGQPFAQQNPSFLAPAINPGCAFFTFTTTPNPSSVNTPSGTVTAKFTNTSTGVNLSSAQVTAPSGLTINPGPASTSTNGGTVSVSGQVVTVTGLTTPVTPGNSLTLTLSVSTTPSCTGTPAAGWSNAQASSGATPTSSTQLTFQGSYPSTSVNAQSCSLSFVSPPAAVAQNTTFSLTVHVTGGSGSPSVTIAATGTGCPALSGTLTQAAPVGSDTTFGGLSFNGSGTCTVTANATNYNNSQATLTSFKVLDGTLAACSGPGSTASSVPPTTPPLNPTSGAIPPADGQTGWALVRGSNTDGSCGPLIPYSFSCDPDPSIRSCLLTEVSLGQHPSVEYIILWPPVLASDDPFADKQPCVSWGVDNPQFPATPDQYGCGGDYVPGLACLTDNVNGGSDNTNTGSANVVVMPIIPNAPPFDAASNPEPQYLADVPNQKRAKVCIAQHGFTSGTGAAVGSVVYWTKVIDQSDSGIRLP